MRTVRLQAVLCEVVPPVRRVLDVPASATLPELHELLQAGFGCLWQFGWTDSHLHQFQTPDAVYGPILPGMELDPPDQRDEIEASLADLGDTFTYGRPAALEEDLYPLLVLHGLLRSCGLLRLRHGVLAPTRAARDDLAAVRRLRTLFEPHAFTTVLTELTTAALAVHGPIPVRDLGGRIFPLLGGGWVRNGMPLTALDVQLHLEQQRHLMSALDLIDTSSQNTWAAGSSAQSLLPGAALLTHTWTSHRDAALDG